MEVGALVVIKALCLSSIGHALRKQRRLLVVKNQRTSRIQSNPIKYQNKYLIRDKVAIPATSAADDK
jgi:hypothetical protein